ncbi:MAG: NADH-quinone oxidoreductase subunit N [Acidimicrobiales bacterium]
MILAIQPVVETDVPDVAWSGMLPLLVLSVAAILLLTIMSLAKDSVPSWFAAAYTAVAGIATIVVAIPLWDRVQETTDTGEPDYFSTLNDAFGVDGFSVMLTMLFGAIVALVALVLHDYLRREDQEGTEYYVLVMMSAAGGIVMASANDLIVMFLGLEVLSLAVYVLAAMDSRRVQSQEAGMKYFVLGALSSAIFLYGIALTYGATGSTNLVSIGEFLGSGEQAVVIFDDALLLAGFALLLVGFGFKVAAVPFHSWAPDVYQGAPTPMVGFMASAVKAAAFAGLLRVFYLTFIDYRTDWQPVIYTLAILTLIFGSLFAIVQTDIKRMLAYSSIAHAGFLLVGVQAATAEGTASVLFYLVAYSFMVIGTFSVVTIITGRSDSHTNLADVKGLGRARPALAFAFTVFLLGQAGIPFTTGFVAKFYVIGAAADARSYGLAIVAMLSAVIAAFLYLRIMVNVWLEANPDSDYGVTVPAGIAIVVTLTLGFTVVFGIWPQPIIEMARDAVPALVRG